MIAYDSMMSEMVARWLIGGGLVMAIVAIAAFIAYARGLRP